MSRHDEMIENAGIHLLTLLQEKPVIPYSDFYDGTDETRARLLAGIGCTEDEADWYSAEGCMDDAAFILEKRGLVERRWLDSKLADGEPAYEIVLTDAGRKALFM